MLRRLGAPVVVSSDPEAIAHARGLILPGVGSFDHAIRKLREGLLLNALEKRVLRDEMPTLGLCLGMQMLSNGSEEGKERGLGWIDAQTIRFDTSKIRTRFAIPFMGWSDVRATREHPLLAQGDSLMRFYFAHSYHVQCNDPKLVIGMAQHGYAFPAAVAKGNVMGVQFHPEKSHSYGMQLLKNFCHLISAQPEGT